MNTTRLLKYIWSFFNTMHERVNFFNEGEPYYPETSPLICSANQWTGFYMIGTFVIKDLKLFLPYKHQKQRSKQNKLYLAKYIQV